MTTIDTAVVGGGVAGLYTTWRLLGAGANPTDIRLYEGVERLGGRILSIKLPQSSVTAELGAMRFSKHHLLLNDLVAHLGLPTQDYTFANRKAFLRGQHLDYEQSGSAFNLPSRLKGIDPLSLIEKGLHEALQLVRLDSASAAFQGDLTSRQLSHVFKDNISYTSLTRAQWDILAHRGKIKGRRLDGIGLWNLMFNCLESEGFSLAHYGLGYESLLANWNAAIAIPWFLRDFASGEYITITGGMESLVRKLSTAVDEAAPYIIETGMKLRKVTQKKTGFELTFQDGSLVHASRLILALPKKGLSGIEYEDFDPELKKQFDERLRAVGFHPLFKLYLRYPEVWWSPFKGSYDYRDVTDLPIRQTYYIPESEGDGGVVMASYSDAHFIHYWRPLHRNVGEDISVRPYRDPSFASDFEAHEEQILNIFGATEAMVRKAHTQIRVIQRKKTVRSIPKPIFGLEKEWTEGWHTWRAHYNPITTMSILRRPFGPEVELYTCGEAYSRDQGWIEGALRSAELALELTGVGAPGWIKEQSYPQAGFSSYTDYIGID